MMQCGQCEYFSQEPDGQIVLSCNPFHNVKEPECLDTMVQAYQATLRMYERLAPLQERMFRQMEREIQDQEDAESWKYGDDDEDDGDDDEDTRPY